MASLHTGKRTHVWFSHARSAAGAERRLGVSGLLGSAGPGAPWSLPPCSRSRLPQKGLCLEGGGAQPGEVKSAKASRAASSQAGLCLLQSVLGSPSWATTVVATHPHCGGGGGPSAPGCLRCPGSSSTQSLELADCGLGTGTCYQTVLRGSLRWSELAAVVALVFLFYF